MECVQSKALSLTSRSIHWNRVGLLNETNGTSSLVLLHCHRIEVIHKAPESRCVPHRVRFSLMCCSEGFYFGVQTN